MELEATFVCLYCLQINTILVETSAGLHQEDIEDCQICCKPNKLVIEIDEELQTAEVYPEMA